MHRVHLRCLAAKLAQKRSGNNFTSDEFGKTEVGKPDHTRARRIDPREAMYVSPTLEKNSRRPPREETRTTRKQHTTAKERDDERISCFVVP